MEMRDFNHSLGRRDGNLIIFTETSGVVEPREGAFNNPTPREYLPRIPLIPSFRSKYPAFCVMNIGSMNHNRQQAAQHIHYDVPLSAFCFFPPSILRSSLAATVFTLWESMIAQLGLPLRPAFVRVFFTRCSRILSHSPLIRARR